MVPRQARGVCYFDFADLCKEDRSAVDYLQLTGFFKVFILANVPVMDDNRRDWAIRFVTLIDTLYDHRVRLVISAAVAPEKLYHGEIHAFAFQRTISRLLDMQSEGYGA
jgi:cell division protein ZapE